MMLTSCRILRALFKTPGLAFFSHAKRCFWILKNFLSSNVHDKSGVLMCNPPDILSFLWLFLPLLMSSTTALTFSLQHIRSHYQQCVEKFPSQGKSFTFRAPHLNYFHDFNFVFIPKQHLVHKSRFAGKRAKKKKCGGHTKLICTSNVHVEAKTIMIYKYKGD